MMPTPYTIFTYLHTYPVPIDYLVSEVMVRGLVANIHGLCVSNRYTDASVYPSSTGVPSCPAKLPSNVLETSMCHLILT